MTLGFLLLTPLLSACGTASPAPGVTITVTAATAAVTSNNVADVVASRTPVPTPTPGPVTNQIDELAAATGLAGRMFLGQPVEQWMNLVVSGILALVGYLVTVILLSTLLRRFVRRTATQFDDAFLDTVGRELREMVLVLVARYALLRLEFWSAGVRTAIDDVSFVLLVLLIVATSLKLIRFASNWYQDKLEAGRDSERLDTMLALAERAGYALAIVIGLTILLSHFGINVTALSAILVVAGAAIVLGGRAVISDTISGFIILVDQPFRVGDVVEIEELNKFGDVMHIGARTTRIQTRDDRSVIIPNSAIATSQVINYTYPDRYYRVQREIGVAYGSDFDQVRRVTEAAVHGVEGVLPDKPVDAHFHDFGDSSRLMRVRWWIDDMHAEKRIIDGVNEALEVAYDKAGIDMPLTTQSVVVQLDSDTIKTLSASDGQPGDSQAERDHQVLVDA
jgi:MscS family membrane protein